MLQVGLKPPVGVKIIYFFLLKYLVLLHFNRISAVILKVRRVFYFTRKFG